MQTKLTLRLDNSLIAKAKHYGQTHGKSVSQLVADYFYFLGQAGQEPGTDELPPLTRSLLGIAAGTQLRGEDYREHRRRKHLGE